MYKGNRTTRKSLIVRDDILERRWESTNGHSKLVQTVDPQNKATDTLAELHGGMSGHPGVNKTMEKVRKSYHCPDKKQCQEGVPAPQHMYSQQWPAKKGSGPHALVQCQGAIQEDIH
jgi:hypothetical protein